MRWATVNGQLIKRWRNTKRNPSRLAVGFNQKRLMDREHKIVY